MTSLEEHLKNIKVDYENAIRSGGTNKVHSLIRSKRLINHIHEYVKEELIAKGINPEKIYPRVGNSAPELKMSGFFKTKSQDIVILTGTPVEEEISDGVLAGKLDSLGKNISERSISINVRSQLSSINKNFDTLYERTFAEPLNLHLRFPKLVTGEIYLMPLVAYDASAAARRRVAFSEKFPAKYIPAFSTISGRESITGYEYKYERACLLIVDFRSESPEVIDSIEKLVEERIIPEADRPKYSLDGLSPVGFIDDLLRLYKRRHGSLVPLH